MMIMVLILKTYTIMQADYLDEEISDELYVDDLLHELYIIVQDRLQAEHED